MYNLQRFQELFNCQIVEKQAIEFRVETWLIRPLVGEDRVVPVTEIRVVRGGKIWIKAGGLWKKYDQNELLREVTNVAKK